MQSIYGIQSFKKLRIYIFICLLNTFLIFEYLFNFPSPLPSFQPPPLPPPQVARAGQTNPQKFLCRKSQNFSSKKIRRKKYPLGSS